MARSKSRPSSLNQTSVKKNDDVLIHKRKSSSSSKKAHNEIFTDNPFGTSDKKTKTFSSKRKSVLPNKRRTFTEEYRNNLKRNVTITRFGKPEICSKKTFDDLKFYRKTTFLLIPKLPFSRLVREIMGQFANFRITATSLEALQEASEMYLVTLFQAANVAAGHAKRKTVMPNDLTLVKFIKNL